MNTETPDIPVEKAESGTPMIRKTLIWLSAGLTVSAWAVLLWYNGYVALVLATLAIIAGVTGIYNSGIALKRIGITSIIASTVLTTVVAAYIIVLVMVLS